MAAEDWELRREARRCVYAAHQAATPSARRMMQGYAKFYETLAENSYSGAMKETPAPADLPMKPSRRDMPRRRGF